MTINYSKKLIRMIMRGQKAMEESFTYPSDQIVAALIGAQSATEAADVAIRYCNNDIDQAIGVVKSLAGTVNFPQQSFLTKVISILVQMKEHKS